MKWLHVGKETFILTILSRFKLKDIFNTNKIGHFYEGLSLETKYGILRLIITQVENTTKLG